MTRGKKKFINLMDSPGYLEISKTTGISKTHLYDMKNGRRDPKHMKLETADRFRLEYDIDFMEWLE